MFLHHIVKAWTTRRLKQQQTAIEERKREFNTRRDIKKYLSSTHAT